MKTRVIAAAFLVPALLLLMLVLPKGIAAIVMGILQAMASYELLYRTHLVTKPRLVVMCAVMSFALAIWSFYGAIHAYFVLLMLVYFLAMGSLYQCILVTFTLSILTICAIDSGSSAKAVAALCAVVLITVFLPQWLPNTDFAVDYSLWGVLLPVAVWLAKTRRHKLLCTAILLSMLALDFGGVQWYGLLALLPLSLYDGTRGSRRLKWLFYWYYPLHLAAIYGIGFLL